MSRRFRERQGARRVQEKGEEGRGRKRGRERPASEGALDVTAPRRPTRRHAVRGSPVPLPPGMQTARGREFKFLPLKWKKTLEERDEKSKAL